jgi:Uma2 family endonuclease
MKTATRKARIGNRNGQKLRSTDELIVVPREAHTLDGFRAWAHSDDLPENLRVCFVQGKIMLDKLDVDEFVEIPREAHTLDGFRAWAASDQCPEKLRVTYLQGKVLLDMSREEIRTHALVKIEVGRVLANLNVDVDFGYLFTDGVLIVNKNAGVSNNPDGVAVFWRSLKRGLVRFLAKNGRETEIFGSPDWALEILSNSSVVKDTVELRSSYHRAKIGEYWLIDARGDDIDFQILYWRKTGYVKAPVADGWQYSRAFQRHFRLVRRRDRLGSWQYQLLVK